MHRPGAHLSALLAHRCDGWPYEPWKALVGLARLYKPDEAHHPYDTFHTQMTSWVPYTGLLSSFPRGEPCVLCKAVHMVYKPLQPFCAFADGSGKPFSRTLRLSSRTRKTRPKETFEFLEMAVQEGTLGGRGARTSSRRWRVELVKRAECGDR